MLLFTGFRTLAEDAGGFAFALALFEIAGSLVLIASVIVAVRKARRPASRAHATHVHHGVDWIDIFTAGLLFAEVAEHWQLKHHVQRPVLLTAIVLLAIGLMHGRIARGIDHRRTIRVGDDDLYIGAKPFRSLRAKWSDVASIEIDPRYATITTRTGSTRRLDLADLEGADAVRAALEEAQGRIPPVN